MAVPIATSTGRGGFGPQLSLSYDAGTGNGPFGFGWSVSLPSITRKTDRGLPQYRDALESDVFILSGVEDLVPVLDQDGNGNWVPEELPTRTINGATYQIRRYLPRVEGLFARIERWTRRDGDTHWRSISKNNILTIYGKDINSRIADSAEPGRVFSWMICETRDDKGNAVLYEYKGEDGTGVDVTKACERNRGSADDPRRTVNRYLKRIRYGNRITMLDDAGTRPALLDASQVQQANWMFEVVFDYGEHDANAPKPDETGEWDYRNDRFSVYRSGFEVRTTRLCRRVLMFHHFEGEAGVGENCLVRSTDFTYSQEEKPGDLRRPIYSFLLAVRQCGYRRQNGGYLRRSLPPLEFEYTQPIVQEAVEDVDADSLENLPTGLDGAAYRWSDLHGEGIPGILTEQAGSWFYKRNLTPINTKNDDGRSHIAARFAPLELVATKPNLTLAGSRAEFIDLAGDGQPDVVVMEGSTPGLYEHDEAEGWQPFRPFTSRPTRDLSDPNIKFVDLDGDGHADVLITEDDAFVWHASLAEDGFGPARRVAQALDEERGPRIVFADGTQSIYLADLSGDGLTDILRIRNGEVCYWPNLGYGGFGAKVTMDNAPWFDHPDQFNHKRIRLADIDGSGTTDIIYLHRDGVRLYFNQCGNSWSQPHLLKVFPRVDDLANMVPTDLLGNGTACLVWSSSLLGDARRPMRYVNLMGGRKPHLLVKTINNLGAETRIDYSPSTKFYLLDKRDGRRWITRLPFPVHVVERVETHDHISRNRFVTRYAYHHGCFDGEEREFCGFGMVEQWDTEEFAALVGGNMPADNITIASHVPPVHTKTWFHTGVHTGHRRVSDQFEGEYFREPGLTAAEARELVLPDTVLPEGFTVQEEREACRALKGSMLRQEVYADDASPHAQVPYLVVEQNFAIRTVQPLGPNRHAVFFTHPREVVSHHYERNPADPRVQHVLTLEVDEFGNVLKNADIGYGRRTQVRVVDDDGNKHQEATPGLAGLDPADRAKQTTTLLTYTENRVTNAIESPDTHRNPLPCEIRTFELTGYPATGAAGRFRASDLVEPDSDSLGRLRHRFAPPEVAYEDTAQGGMRRRPIEWLRTLYRRDDLGGLLPLGEVQPLGLSGESYRLAFTPGLLAQVYGSLLPDPAGVLGDAGGYRQSQALKALGRFPTGDADDHWWTSSGQSFYSTNPADDAVTELAQARQHFFLPRRHRDAFGQDTSVTLDGYDLLMVETRDSLGNRVTVEANDYRVLQPRLVSDENRNRTEIGFDTLGLVVGTAVMGKPSFPAPVEGDTLDGFAADLTDAELDGLFDAADPHASAAALLRDATSRIVYDLDRFRRTRQADPVDPTTWRPVCAATLARETHAGISLPAQGLRIQVGFSYSDGFGRQVQKKAQAEPGPGGQPRWVGSGWTIYNNKGNPVRQYEPFFSATHRFEFGVAAGVSPVMFYDPAERVIVTLYPNHTYEKVVFDPWRQTAYDANDTVAARGAQTGDPRTDPDVAGFVAEYFKAKPSSWQTWHAQRIGGAIGPDEQTAAQRAAAHADTPITAHFDTLGRPFLSVGRNRVVCRGHDLDGSEEAFTTRVELDIEGNEREVRDALGRVVVRYAYDLPGNRIHQLSMEAGERWTLGDADGRPIRAWDGRGHMFTTKYDALRRPVEQTVRGSTVDSDPRTLNRDIVFDRTEYGEGVAGDEALNLRGRIHRHFDAAGVATSDAYDFKGNLLHSTRRLVWDYVALPDWAADPALDDESFEGSSSYDALNRPVQTIAPHSSLARAPRSVIQPVYNAASLLERVDVWLERPSKPDGLLDAGAEPPSPVGVANIDYDARGRRIRIDYKNGVGTSYTYDPLTFRLTHVLTQRAADAVQDLRYTYDPAGNAIRIRDGAQQTVFFNNRRVEPSTDYVYDALYRLIQANGREHLGQGGAPTTHSPNDASHVRLPHPGDGNAMGRYFERYVYDAVGNFLQMQHRGSDPAHAGWTRAYDYLEPSPLAESGPATSNRLSRNRLNPNGADPPRVEPYEHDVHGNVVRLPHLGGGQAGPNMHWDHTDRLRRVDLGGGGFAWYVYDSAGMRVRKVWEKAPGLIEERIYLGRLELFRRHGGPIGPDTAKLERETLHVMDDKQRIALVETRTLDTEADDPAPRRQIRYQFSNHLGSAGLELDEQAQIVSYEEYAPYGSSTYQAVRSQTETAKRYRYTGKERDEESGLYYHGARYYACWQGRWMACDPKGLTDAINLYAYVGGNPVAKSDPTGTDGKGGDNVDDAIGGAADPQFEAHGKSGLKRKPITMDIDEPKAVGDRGISPTEARNRATDVNNRQFLDPGTNRRTKYLGTDSRAATGTGSAVSVAKDPNALLNRNFGQITEMRDIFNEALSRVKNPGKLSPTKLKEAINKHMWDIIKNGTGDSAQKVREALQKLGFENVKGQGYVMRNPAGATSGSGLSAVDADVDPRTGQVVDGPKTKAAMARREAKAAAAGETKAAAAEAKAVVKQEAKAVTSAPKFKPGPVVTPPKPGPLARVGGVPGVAMGVLILVNIYFAYESYQDGLRPNTPAPVGDGMIGGSQGEAILNAAGTLAGGAPAGTMLRQAAEFGSTGSDPKKVWNAITSGTASPTSIGMGIFFGAFR
jgi:RHS repeat-associated protein